MESFRTEGCKSGIRWMARDLKPSVFGQAVILFQEGRSVRQVIPRRSGPPAALSASFSDLAIP